MKKIKNITNLEMRKLSPKLFEALDGNPNDVIYCIECDGLRVKNHEHGGQFYEAPN